MVVYEKCACCASTYTAASYEYRLMAAVVGFHCDVIRCELVRRGVGYSVERWGAARGIVYGRA